MAFPSVASRITSVVSTNTTTHPVLMPSGVVSGNLLSAKVCADGNTVITVPAGWTKFFDPDLGSAIRFIFAYRQSDGDEGPDENFTTDFAQKSAHSCYRITGHEDPSTQAPEASTGADSVSSSPDPDALSPTGGSKEYLWLAAQGHDGLVTTDTFPINYTDGISAESTGGGSVGVGSAERQLEAATENPGIFILSGSEEWQAGTVAVHPAAAVADIIDAATLLQPTPYWNRKFTVA